MVSSWTEEDRGESPEGDPREVCDDGFNIQFPRAVFMCLEPLSNGVRFFGDETPYLSGFCIASATSKNCCTYGVLMSFREKIYGVHLGLT
jgi:hypothetical protein